MARWGQLIVADAVKSPGVTKGESYGFCFVCWQKREAANWNCFGDARRFILFFLSFFPRMTSNWSSRLPLIGSPCLFDNSCLGMMLLSLLFSYVGFAFPALPRATRSELAWRNRLRDSFRFLAEHRDFDICSYNKVSFNSCLSVYGRFPVDDRGWPHVTVRYVYGLCTLPDGRLIYNTARFTVILRG